MKKNVTLKTVATENQNTQTTITLGSIIKSESGMPIIETLLDGKCVGYLSPFRGYSFQVSMTSAGQWDMGSSPCVGLKNVLEAVAPGTRGPGYQSNLRWDGEAQACLLKGLALQALHEYASSVGAVLDLGKHSFEKYTDESGEPRSKYYKDHLEKFISIVVEYLKEV